MTEGLMPFLGPLRCILGEFQGYHAKQGTYKSDITSQEYLSKTV